MRTHLLVTETNDLQFAFRGPGNIIGSCERRRMNPPVMSVEQL
jgi:hypothetical protein